MARKKEPTKPFYSIKHDYEDSLKEFEHASMMLYNAVTTILRLEEHIKDPAAKRMVEQLREHAEHYGKVVHGEAP
jgi:hypothetical protein